MSLSSPEVGGYVSAASDSDSHPTPDPGPSSETERPGQRRKLACVECRRRKIKCDREHPCLSCILGGRQCELPGPGPPRRPRRRNHHELHDRLAGLEALLKQCVGSVNAPTTAATTSACPSEKETESEPDSSPPGYLVQTPSGVEFRGSETLVAVFQDLPTVQTIQQVEAEQATWLPSQTHHPSTTSFHEPFIPSPNEVIVLWRIFLDRVDPVTKIIHAPSFRPNIVNAAAGFRNMPLQTKGLLFAMFIVASVALSKTDHWELLGRSREDTIAAYSASFRAVLAQYSYLANYNLDTLRSLALYALVQKTPYGTANLWVFNGILVNMAYRLGIHIDGTRAQLSVFETEMRRRLWWMIIQLDVTESVTNGIGTLLLPRNREARLPLNINDDDLDPEMTEEPTPRVGFTEMTYCRASYELTSLFLLQQGNTTFVDAIISGKASSATSEKSPPFMDLDTLLEVLQKLERELTSPVTGLPEPAANPLHALVLDSRTAAIKGLKLATEPMEETPEWGIEVHSPRDNLFRISLISMENMMDRREKCGPEFAWYTNLDLNVEACCILAAQLQARVSGSLADRAWALVDRMYRHHEELWDLGEKDKMTLGNLLLAAWQSRVDHFAAKRIGLPEPPFLARLRDEIMMIKAQAINLF